MLQVVVTHIVQSSDCLMLFLLFHIFWDVLFTACGNALALFMCLPHDSYHSVHLITGI